MTKKSLEVLLADDDADDVMVIQMLFAEASPEHGINFVRNGEEVISYLRREGQWKKSPRPSLILLDLNMPKLDGFEVLKEIKADRDLCTIPVIVLSTSSADSDIQHAFQLGACSFITKPANFEKFRELMQQFVRYWTYVTHVPTI